MREIRRMLRGLDAEQIEVAFGHWVRRAYEACRNGASPYEKFPKGGVRYMAGLEALAQHRHEWQLNRRIAAARHNAGVA